VRRLVAPWLAALLTVGCRNPRRPAPADAPHSPWTLVVAQSVSRPAAQDAGATLALVDEPRLAAPPASPPDCTLELPVRSVIVGEGPVSFSTAAAGARSLLALATARETLLVIARGDATILSLPPPFAPASTVSASGALDVLALAWSERTALARRSRPQVAIVDERESLRAYTLADHYALTMTELLCHRALGGVRCAVGLGWREEFEGDDDGRARFYRFDPASAGATLTLEAADAIARSAPHAVSAVDPLRALLRRDGRIEQPLPDGGGTPLGASVVEVASIAGVDRTLTATAPRTERCQPSAWTLALSQPAGAPSPIGVADARPRGARVRGTGADGSSPVVFWLDDPQCGDRSFVIRASHAGSSIAIASATEYDAASDRALVSVAWRDAERVRWARYRCPR
jgi:hypothetical protein